METTKWAIDPTHSEITFKVKHLMISNVKGEFKTFQGTIDGEDFTKATISANIDASSISTNNDDRDTHLKSPDFFEVEKYPEITFCSIHVSLSGVQYCQPSRLHSNLWSLCSRCSQI